MSLTLSPDDNERRVRYTRPINTAGKMAATLMAEELAAATMAATAVELFNGITAVDNQIRAGYHICRIAGQKQSAGRDLVRVGKSAGRQLPFEFFSDLACPCFLSEFSQSDGRGDGIDLHVMFSPLNGQHFCDSDNRGFACHIRNMALQSNHARLRTNVNDFTAAGTDHFLGDQLRQKEGGLQIEVERFV